jgi:hypothetical protein
MFTNQDKKFLKETFATKSDIKGLGKQKDLLRIESKVDSVQRTLDDLVEVVAPINPWMDEIHNSIVKEELPRRVKRIEKRLGLSPLP